MSCGIYKIQNKINGKVYIGQSSNIEERWKAHLSPSVWRDKPNKVLYKAFKKHGVDNFSFEILETCHTNDLSTREIKYITKFNSYNNGYNMTLGGEGVRGLRSELIRKCSYLMNRTSSNFKSWVVVEHELFRSLKEFRSYYGCEGKTIDYIKEHCDVDDIESYDPYNDDHVFLSIEKQKSDIEDFMTEIFYATDEGEIDKMDRDSMYHTLVTKLEILDIEFEMCDLSSEFIGWLEIKESVARSRRDDDDMLEYDSDWEFRL